MSIERQPEVAQSPELESTPENPVDRQYLQLLQHILENGEVSGDRTETGTIKDSGHQLEFNPEDGFPLLTTKRVFFRGVKEELLWFISGEKNIRPLVEKSVSIWSDWPYERYLEENGLEEKLQLKNSNLKEWKRGVAEYEQRIVEDDEFAQRWGDAGPVYGYMWRHWPTKDGGEIDQLARAIDMIKKSPNSRRILISAWNPEYLNEMTLPPCHDSYQFTVSGNRLNLTTRMRSVDTFLGLPFNIASYAMLQRMVAQVTDKEIGKFALQLGDSHIYLNHREQVKKQLSREPRKLPSLKLNPDVRDIDDFRSEDIEVEGYNPHPHIPAPISV